MNASPSADRERWLTCEQANWSHAQRGASGVPLKHTSEEPPCVWCRHSTCSAPPTCIQNVVPDMTNTSRVEGVLSCQGPDGLGAVRLRSTALLELISSLALPSHSGASRYSPPDRVPARREVAGTRAAHEDNVASQSCALFL